MLKKDIPVSTLYPVRARDLSEYEKEFLEQLGLRFGAKWKASSVWKKEGEHKPRRFWMKLVFHSIWLGLIALLFLTNYFKMSGGHRLALFAVWVLGFLYMIPECRGKHVFSWDAMKIYHAVENKRFLSLKHLYVAAMAILLVYQNHILTMLVLLAACLINLFQRLKIHMEVSVALPEAEKEVNVRN